MSKNINRSWTLNAHPVGVPQLSDFRMIEQSIPEPLSREILVEVHYHSLDPYMRGRMNPPNRTAYTKGISLGGGMEADAVGKVVLSNSEMFDVGDYVMGKIGWQEYGILDEKEARKVDSKVAPPSTSLGILGMPGLTAYYGLFEIGRPKAGDTLVVTAASGAVGAIVGQLGKISGCRVIGVAGSNEKTRYVLNELNFDACINYKSEDVADRFNELCSGAIDIYWDNVGGPVTDAAIDNIAIRGKAVVCGQISNYNAVRMPQGPRNIPRMLLSRRAVMEGFLVYQFRDRYAEGLLKLATWIQEGLLKYKEDIIDGIENSPSAFIGLLQGSNFGKLLVKVK